jgi:hypothetical protein
MAFIEPVCIGHQGDRCQFAGLHTGVHEFAGSYYCQLHAPLDAPWKQCASDIFTALKSSIDTGSRRFFGVRFPAKSDIDLSNPNNTEIELVDSEFGPAVCIQTKHNSLSITSAQFRGAATFITSDGAVTCRNINFPSRVVINSANCRVRQVDFSGSTFNSGLSLEGVNDGPWLFRSARFRGDISINAPTLSQGLSFSGARFRGPACDAQLEGSYRVIRQLFETNSDRENEGLFYALEKRCHRKSLSRRSLARPVSTLYDWISGYGQSYERAFWWLLGWQAVFALLCSLLLGRWQIGAALDWELIAFTFAQVAKPFELFSGRLPAYAQNLTLDQIPAGWGLHGWALLGLLHSVISISLLALFVLALRWRFRRA